MPDRKRVGLVFAPDRKSSEAAVTASSGNARLRLLHVVPTYLPAVRYGGPVLRVYEHSLAIALFLLFLI